jgi:hypothetical protein
MIIAMASRTTPGDERDVVIARSPGRVTRKPAEAQRGTEIVARDTRPADQL